MSRFIANSFQVPNALVDELMSDMSGNALKCYMVITRKTTGWGKSSDKISISQFKLLCGKGMSDDRTVQSALNELEQLNLIRTVKASGLITEFSLIVSQDELSTNNVPTKNDGGSKECTQPHTNNVGTTTHKICRSTKDNNKNTITKNNIKKINKKDFDFSALAQPIEDSVMNDFVSYRKSIKKPLTQSAINHLVRELNKAIDAGYDATEIMEMTLSRGWQSFSFSYLNNQQQAQNKTQVEGKRFMTRSERNMEVLNSMRSQ